MTRDIFSPFEPHDRGLFGDNEQRESESQVLKCEIDIFCHNDNPKKQAIAVSYDRLAPYGLWIWLPRSLIEVVKTGAIRNVSIVRVMLPEKLAKEKGLI